MNKKKIAYVTVIITCLLSVSLIFQPQVKRVSAANGDLVFYNRIAPNGDVYQDDDYLYGGTIYNNRSDDTYRITQIRVDFYTKLDNGTIEHTDIAADNFPDNDPRYEIAPYESRTFTFQNTMNLTIGSSYNVTITLFFIDVTSTVETPFSRLMEDNATINVLYKRPPSPTYIWAVLVLLSAGILAMVIVGIVGWVKERREKK